MRHLLLTLALLLLASCAPTPGVERSDPEGVGALYYRYEPLSGGAGPIGQLVITTRPEGSELPEHPPLVSGYADITGYDLRVASPYCVDACAPNEYGFIGFSLPVDSYGDAITVDVLDGEPVAGLAVFDIGVGVSVEAEFVP